MDFLFSVDICNLTLNIQPFNSSSAMLPLPKGRNNSKVDRTLFKDMIIITYNFKMNSDTGIHTPETVEKLLNEVESAFSKTVRLYRLPRSQGR